MNGKFEKKKYHDIKKIFGKEYFKSYFIKPKVHLSLSPSSNRFQSDTKNEEIISPKNSFNNLSSKLSKYSQNIKISKNKSNINYFKLVKDNNKNFTKTKILIKSLVNKSNNNILYNNNLSISNRSPNFDKKNNYGNISNINNSNNNDNIYNKIIANINKKQTDINLKNIKINKNKKNRKNNKKILCDSLFKIDRGNKIKLKNFKNKNRIFKNNKSKKIIKSIEINDKECNKFNNMIYNKSIDSSNNKNYINTIESRILVKKIKINNSISNPKRINENKSCDVFSKKKFQIKKSKKKNILKKNIKYILFNSTNNSSSLYSQIFTNNKLSGPDKHSERNKKIQNYTNNKNTKNSMFSYKQNKSIDINKDSFKKKFLGILKEQRKKLKEEEFKEKMKEIKVNSKLRKLKYIELFNKINNSFNDIKILIEQIEKEDLLKNVTLKVSDDISYESILNNENSISIEKQFKSIFNNGLFNNKNTKNKSYSENTTSIINNDFTFEEDKRDIFLKSIDIKKNSIIEKNKSISNIDNNKKNEEDNCFIF